MKLADGKERNIQHMMATTFGYPDALTERRCPPSSSSRPFFGKLPEFFKSEAELRSIWSAADTRANLLQGLAEKGFEHEQLNNLPRCKKSWMPKRAIF
ncbi:MAG: type I restriction-modification enzyme R subunit C-terminal domain-containing protein [Verrucomicrobiota bacterium]